MNINAKLRHHIKFYPFTGLNSKGDETFGTVVSSIPCYIDQTVAGKIVLVQEQQKTIQAQLLMTNPSTIGEGFKVADGYDQFGVLILAEGRIARVTRVWHYRRGKVYTSASII